MNRAVRLILTLPAVIAAQTPKTLPLQLVDTTKPDTTFTWSQLRAQHATLAVWNGESTKRQFGAGVTRFPEDASDGKQGEIQILVTSGGSVPPRSIAVLQFSAQEPAEPGEYTGFLILSDPAGRLAPVKRQIHISVPGPDPLVSKLTATLTREVPGTSWFCSREIDLPIRDAAARNGHRRLIGALRGSLGGWTLVRGDGSGKIAVDAPPRAGTYDGDVKLTSDSKTAVTLTVVVQDFVAWPVAAILAGVGLALLVKRYLGVTRVVWGLREQDAEAGEQYRYAQRIFEEAARGRSFAGDSIRTAVEEKRNAIEKAINDIASSWSTAIEPTDAHFMAATAGLKDLFGSIAIWRRIADALGTLAVALDDVRSTAQNMVVEPAEASKTPVFLAAGRALLDAKPDLSLEGLATLSENVASVATLAKSWPGVAQNLSDMTEEFQDLVLPPDASGEATTKYENVLDAIRTTWRALLAVQSKADLDGLSGFGNRMGQTRVALDQVEAVLRPRSKGMAQVPKRFAQAIRSLAVPDESTAAAGQEDEVAIGDGRKVELLRRAIKAGDTGAVLFSILLATLTGLSSLYLGKPFGSFADYVALFLWAAGTKATLDILAGILDKLSMVQRLSPGR